VVEVGRYAAEKRKGRPVVELAMRGAAGSSHAVENTRRDARAARPIKGVLRSVRAPQCRCYYHGVPCCVSKSQVPLVVQNWR
jgi:hypothetical protein